MARPPVSIESIERALRNAHRHHWINRWQRHPEGGHIVHVRNGPALRFLNNQETNAFCHGLAAVDRNRPEHLDPTEIMNPDEGESK
jgi:hypothetical protein